MSSKPKSLDGEIPFMDERNTPRPSKKIITNERSTSNKRALPVQSGRQHSRSVGESKSVNKTDAVGRAVQLIQTSTLIGQEVQLSSFCPIKTTHYFSNNTLIG